MLVLGYGKVKRGLYMSVKNYGAKATLMELNLSEARINYMMRNPTSFLYVEFYYDPNGKFGELLPEGIDTKDRIYVAVYDNRGIFSDKSEIDLLDEFKERLNAIYSFIKFYATDMDADIVAQFYDRNNVCLGYFYQGEYHLWGE